MMLLLLGAWKNMSDSTDTQKCLLHLIRYEPNCKECYLDRPETLNIFWEVKNSGSR